MTRNTISVKKEEINELKKSFNNKNRPQKIKSEKKELLSSPIQHFDAINNSGVYEVIKSFEDMAFQSKNLARCLNILIRALEDKDRPVIFMGLAGAMVPAGLRKVIRDMIKLHIVDAIVATGANLYHDLHESLGYNHYSAKTIHPDVELRRHKIDRILDVYADDDEFQNSDQYIATFADKLKSKCYSSREFLYLLGNKLNDDNSILATASRENIPIFCPSIADSSIGIGLTMHKRDKILINKPEVIIDVLQDNLEIVKIRSLSEKSAAIYIGGGVPKNYIQQITPMAEVLNLDIQGHTYAIQITTDDPKWGGLSGCTLEESQSWGKLTEDARHATTYVDATVGLPLLLKAIIEIKSKWYPRNPLKINWETKTIP
jgi:deoxyhypusine synthase